MHLFRSEIRNLLNLGNDQELPQTATDYPKLLVFTRDHQSLHERTIDHFKSPEITTVQLRNHQKVLEIATNHLKLPEIALDY